MNWIGWLISLASLIVAICALVGVGKAGKNTISALGGVWKG